MVVILQGFGKQGSPGFLSMATTPTTIDQTEKLSKDTGCGPLFPVAKTVNTSFLNCMKR